MTETAITLKTFFETAGAGRLTAIKCGRCGNLEIPPKEFCDACGQRDWKSALLSGDGTIASYTIIRVARTKHAGEAPYAIAAVKLREGVSLLGRLVGIPLDKVSVGMPVRFRPLVIRNETAVGFSPA